ncbi:MAG: hypothetical protein JWQ27_2559 [Ferruginibacter sp.]|nr:hypothetical protein [Ferruginibacter sp.]
MKSITKIYLAEIIYRCINETISLHREAKRNSFYVTAFPTATDEEVLDFVHSIPYFDVRLKDFLLGQLIEDTIIISQSWELEFMKKTRLWAESFEWLHGSYYYLSDAHLDKLRAKKMSLSLPY